MPNPIWVLSDYGIEAVSEYNDLVPVCFLRDDGPYDVVARPVDVAQARRWRFVLNADNTDKAEVADFIRTDLQMGTLPFLFQDGRDAKVLALALGNGTGAQTVFPLPTTRSGASYGQYPLDAASTVAKVNAIAVATGSRTIDVDGRDVTFAVAPGLGLAVTLDYFYYRLCRIVQETIDWKGITSVWQSTEFMVEEVLV